MKKCIAKDGEDEESEKEKGMRSKMARELEKDRYDVGHKQDLQGLLTYTA